MLCFEQLRLFNIYLAASLSDPVIEEQLGICWQVGNGDCHIDREFSVVYQFQKFGTQVGQADQPLDFGGLQPVVFCQRISCKLSLFKFEQLPGNRLFISVYGTFKLCDEVYLLQLFSGFFQPFQFHLEGKGFLAGEQFIQAPLAVGMGDDELGLTVANPLPDDCWYLFVSGHLVTPAAVITGQRV